FVSSIFLGDHRADDLASSKNFQLTRDAFGISTEVRIREDVEEGGLDIVMPKQVHQDFRRFRQRQASQSRQRFAQPMSPQVLSTGSRRQSQSTDVSAPGACDAP